MIFESGLENNRNPAIAATGAIRGEINNMREGFSKLFDIRTKQKSKQKVRNK